MYVRTIGGSVAMVTEMALLLWLPWWLYCSGYLDGLVAMVTVVCNRHDTYFMLLMF